MCLPLSYWQPNYDLTPSSLKDHVKFYSYLHTDATSWLEKNLINEGSNSTKCAMWDQLQLLTGGRSCGNHCFYDIVITPNATFHFGSIPNQTISEFWTNIKNFLNQLKYFIQPPNVFKMLSFHLGKELVLCTLAMGWWNVLFSSVVEIGGGCRQTKVLTWGKR